VDRTPSFLKWLASSLVGIALFTGLFLLKGNGNLSPLTPEVTSSASPATTKASNKVDLHNLLIIVARDDKRIAGSFLIVTDRHITKIRIFSITPRVVIDTQGSVPTDLVAAGFNNSSSVIQQALEDASGVRIDGSLVLQRLALAGLVDSVHGIDLINPHTIRVRPQEHKVVIIPAGKVHLDGSRAAAYALVRLVKEPRSAQAMRIDSVLQATLSKLPNGEERMKETLSSLGSLSRTTVPTGDVARYLVRLNHKQVWRVAKSTPLATVPSLLGGKSKGTWERFDLQQVNKQVGNFTTSAFTEFSKTNIRIAVSSKFAADRLAARRNFRNTPFVFVDGGQQILPKVTRVKVWSGVAPKTIVSLRKALGLKKMHIVYVAVGAATDAHESAGRSAGHSIADITVTLGVDYRDLLNNQESVD